MTIFKTKGIIFNTSSLRQTIPSTPAPRSSPSRLFAIVSDATPPARAICNRQSKPHRAHSVQPHSGFSLIELMISLCIMVILLSVAAPSYEAVTTSNRLSQETGELLNDIEFARSESMKRGLTVVVCPSSDGSSCATQSSWESGWITIASTQPNGCDSNAGKVLRSHQAFASKDSATYTPSIAGNTLICLNRAGAVNPDYRGRFVIDSPRGSSGKRCLSTFASNRSIVLRAGQTDTGGQQC